MYLQNTTKSNIHKNSSVNYKGNNTQQLDALEVDREFYCQPPKNSIEQLYDTIYATDFQMLGYEYPQQYIDMGIDDDV